MSLTILILYNSKDDAFFLYNLPGLKNGVITMLWRVQPLLLLGKPDSLVGNLISVEEVAFKGSEGVLLDGGMYLMHHLGDKAKIMYGG